MTPDLPRRSRRARIAPFALAVLGGCGFAASAPSWEDQLAPSGPCYEADLSDGLDAPAELHTVFACLNRTGALDAARPIDAALDAPTRDGAAPEATVGGVAAAWVVEAAGAAEGASLSALVEAARDLVAAPEEWRWALEAGLELLYARPYDGLTVEGLAAPSALEAGLIAPLSPAAGHAAGAILDDDLAPLGPARDLLRSEALVSLAWSAALLPHSDDPALQALAEGWPQAAARLIRDSADTSNNRHPGSGDSLRDLAEAALIQTGNDGRPALAHLSDPLLPILADPGMAPRLEGWIASELALGNLQQVPAQLLYLASVDGGGGALSEGEGSALAAMVRLLARADQPVRCETEILGIWPVSIEVDNLSVRILELLADQDPGNVEGAVALLSVMLGADWLTGPILEAVPDYCPALDDQMISDLYALDRLTDGPAHGLVHALVTGLQALDAGGHTAGVVDLLSTAWAFDLVPPVEELLRDQVGGPLLEELMAALPSLVALDDRLGGLPEAALLPPGVELPDTGALLRWMLAILSPDAEGRTPLDRLGPPLQAVLAQEGSWEALAHLADLLEAPGSRTAGLLDRLLPLVEADPSLSWAPGLADTLEDPALVRPALVLLESEALRGAALTTSLTEEGPAPFLARLVVGGTLDVLVATLDLLLDLLPAPPDSPAPG